MNTKFSIVTLIAMMLISVSAIAADSVVVIPLGGKKSAGDAVAADVLVGKTFSNKDAVDIPGAMVNNGAVSFTPGITSQTIPAGYHNGSGTVLGDTALISANIKAGAVIFSVTGTSVEASGTATPAQVLSGQSFSNASGPATGAMVNNGAVSITPGTFSQTIPEGYHDGSGTVTGGAGLVTGNIKNGITLFGVSGDVNVVDTADATATASDVLEGRSAYVKGSPVIGTGGMFWGCARGGGSWDEGRCLVACVADIDDLFLCNNACSNLNNTLESIMMFKVIICNGPVQ